MIYGLLIIAILGLMGGVIAYVGDKLGTKVGKRKISLFGLRPKHTSILVTIVTGILIAATTLGVMGILSENVRIALFGVEQLQEKTQALTVAVDEKNKALMQSRHNLETMTEQIKRKNEELHEVQASYDMMQMELISVQAAYREANTKLNTAQAEIDELETVKNTLTEHVESLQVLTDRLKAGLLQIREGEVLFRVGEVLSGAVVRPGLTEGEAATVLSNFINDTNGLILRRIESTDATKEMIYVSRENFNEVAKEISAAQEPVFLRLVTLANVIYGEPVLARFETSPYKLIYEKNTVILDTFIPATANPETAVLSFLRDVNKIAQEKGVLPNPLTNEVGQIANKELAEVIEQVKAANRSVRLEAMAADYVYSDGPVKIHLRVVEP